MMNPYIEYETKCERIREENKVLLSDFGVWLTSKGLSEKVIQRHLSNIDLYVNVYLLYEDAIEPPQGVYHFGMFLDYWFIKKVLGAGESSIRSSAASLKKFYAFMHERGLVSEQAVKEMRERMREDMPEWLATMRRLL